MNEHSDEERAKLREKVLGLGERSLRKTYFPELQQQIQQLKRFRALLDCANDFIFLLELPSLSLVDVNESACHQLGYEHDFSLEAIMDPSGYRRLRQFFAQAVPGDRRIIAGTLKQRSGREIPIEMTLTVSVFEDRSYGITVARDISDRKRLESERARLQEERARIKSLKETDRLKDEFLSTITHELRTPLNAITGFGSILDDEVLGMLNGQQHQVLEKILRASERMLGLVNDLLDFAKIRAGKFTVIPRETAYPLLVQDAVSALGGLAEAKGIEFECDLQVPVPVSLDGERIHQVLSNLLSNAIKFTQPGGRIRIRAHLEGKSVVTEVTDNGIGIAPDQLPLLFTPFTQLPTTQRKNGSGLGLSIAKGIVEAHGGTIEASSPGLGQGSTFRFTLPLKPSTGSGQKTAPLVAEEVAFPEQKPPA